MKDSNLAYKFDEVGDLSDMAGFSVPGIGSGIDWSTYIASVRKDAEDAIRNTLSKQQGTNSQKQATYGQVQGVVNSLVSVVQGFQFAKDFKTKSVDSSDDGVVKGTATVSALNTSTTLSVEKLATNEVFQASFTGVNNVVTTVDGVFNITVRGVAKSVSVPAGTTLTTLAGLINSANIGVTATAFDTGAGGATPARLTITDNQSGQADPDNTTWHPNLDFTTTASTLTDLSNGAFAVQTEGSDSKILIPAGSANAIYRDNNTVVDAIPGVTLTLVSAEIGVSKTVTVTESLGQASLKIKDFITKYNTLVSGLKTVTAYNASSDIQQATAGDSTLLGILSSLMDSATSSQRSLPPGSVITSLADLGITTVKATGGQTAGTLEFDESKFSSVLSSHYDDVVTFFEGKDVTLNGSTVHYTGFGKNMTDVVGGFVKSDGALSSKMSSLQKEGTRIDAEIQKKLDKIARNETFLKDKFARLEVILAKLNAQMSTTTSSVNSIALNNQAMARQ